MFLFCDSREVSLNPQTFTSLIAGLAKASKMSEAVRVLEAMIEFGVKPNVFSYNAVLHGFAKVRATATLLGWFTHSIYFSHYGVVIRIYLNIYHFLLLVIIRFKFELMFSTYTRRNSWFTIFLHERANLVHTRQETSKVQNLLFIECGGKKSAPQLWHTQRLCQHTARQEKWKRFT